MSLRGGRGKPFADGRDNGRSSKGKNISDVSIPKVEQLSQHVADTSLDSPQDGDGWEFISRKSKNRAGSSAAKPWGSQNSNPKPWGGMRSHNGSGRASGNSWGTQITDSKMASGRGNARPQISNRTFENYLAPQSVIPPPLEHGWNWQSRAGSAPSKGLEDGQGKDRVPFDDQKENDVDEVDYDSDADAMDDSDDGFLSDEFDSDASQKSHGTRKKNKWFTKFFNDLDSLSVEQINETERQWHCPACQGGPGAIDWYRGLQPLMTHAKTKGSKRVKLHRELAELLDEELRRRGASVVPAGEAFGKWKGLKDEERDFEIVWPPMVVIMNTRLDKDDNDKWVGMGNQELLEYFSAYAAAKARHSYGPQGHRGMSVLIFENSARGYYEAERLHKHFAEQGTHREAWNRNHPVLFLPGGKRQLYGFMATKDDLNFFNQHSQGKSRLKFEMRSYQEMVVKQMRQMAEDNQQLIWYKNKVAREQRAKVALEDSLGLVSEKLRKTMEENRIVKQRTKMQHEENKEEMDMQEQFFKEQIKYMHEARDAREEEFEKLQQLEREKVKRLNTNPSNTEEYIRRAQEIEKFIKFQDEEMEAFVSERDELIKMHERKMAEMRKRHLEEEVALEKEFDDGLNQLMEKYMPKSDGSQLTTA
ncbi:hypothetical protein SLA2020_225610 [Shorea laevis]